MALLEGGVGLGEIENSCVVEHEPEEGPAAALERSQLERRDLLRMARRRGA